jgi:cold shock CspA family protein
MQSAIHLSAQDYVLSAEEEALIRGAVRKLERFYDALMACSVAVTIPNRRSTGTPVAYLVRVDLTVPGGELAITRQPKPSFREAVSDAFSAARRQLQDYARRQRAELPTAEEPATRGCVTRLLRYEGYGFITSDDGREIYFHRNAVPNSGFDRLSEGTSVRFVEQEGREGPQASTVVALGTG